MKLSVVNKQFLITFIMLCFANYSFSSNCKEQAMQAFYIALKEEGARGYSNAKPHTDFLKSMGLSFQWNQDQTVCVITLSKSLCLHSTLNLCPHIVLRADSVKRDVFALTNSTWVSQYPMANLPVYHLTVKEVPKSRKPADYKYMRPHPGFNGNVFVSFNDTCCDKAPNQSPDYLNQGGIVGIKFLNITAPLMGVSYSGNQVPDDTFVFRYDHEEESKRLFLIVEVGE